MNTKAIRKELAILRNKLVIGGMSMNKALNEAQSAMNKKYGKDWRNDTPQFKGRSNDLYYQDHENGEHWMD